MIIPITELKRFKQFATALFGHGLVKRTTMIHLYPQNDSCTIEASSHGRTVTLEVGFEPDSRELDESVTLAPETLDQICLGEGDAYFSEVASTENGSRFTISWQQGVVRRTVELDHNSPEPQMAYDYQPVRIDDRFLGCLHQCVQLTDDNAVRYALYCVQLDGRDGSMTATDGSQLLRFTGFEFPWTTEASLIRNCKLFKLSEFAKLQDVSAGISGDNFLLTTGPWRFTLPIERECRFPDVSRVIPATVEATNRIDLNADDRAVLSQCISQLPGESEAFQPVTLDLNGHVAIIGQSTTESKSAAILELDRSVHIGPDRQLQAARSNLENAAKLGAESLFIFEAGKPILARSGRMQFLWMPLEGPQTNCDVVSAQKIIASQVTVRSRRTSPRI